MAISWKVMSDKEILAKASDHTYLMTLTAVERERCQLDLCRRFDWIFERPDGVKPPIPEYTDGSAWERPKP